EGADHRPPPGSRGVPDSGSGTPRGPGSRSSNHRARLHSCNLRGWTIGRGAGRAGGGRILWDPIPLEVVSGDPGVGGIRLQKALEGLPGVRLLPAGASAERFTVEVEVRSLPEMALRADLPKGRFLEIRELGAPSTPVLERLKQAGIEARESR
ncbi:MAG TPA: hypothetical protein VKF62_00460, partial [Planctomycetota bacterium]|nr:hypothetical protein [Planctomycetota bacterium]